MKLFAALALVSGLGAALPAGSVGSDDGMYSVQLALWTVLTV